MSDHWDPAQYGRFAAERAQPFWDLVELVERAAARGSIRRAVDLGCGMGELTAAMGRRLGIADVLGIDRSPAMLAGAGAHAGPGVRFATGDLGAWTGAGDHDLVFANASLQWVPDHAGVLARWWAGLRPGGHLAVQVPANADHPSHVVAGQVADDEPFRSAMGGTPPPDPVARNVLPPERYATLLDALGASRQTVRLQVYGHRLASTHDVVEWVRGTSLTRIFAALPAELHDAYVAEYRRRLLAVLGDQRPCFYPFKRILLWAQR